MSWAETLASEQIQIERKRFLVALKENPSGRFLRVTELMGDRSNTIIIPTSGLREFSKLLGEMMKAADEIQPLQHESQSEGNPGNEATADVSLTEAGATARV